MRRYWLSEDSLEGGSVLIDGEEFHHICHVCRQEEGAKFEVLVGDGKARLIELVEIGKKQARGRVIEVREIQTLGEPLIHLALSVPKFQKMELILEKAVELGVYEVIPCVSDYSFVRKTSGPLAQKKKRFEKIIQSATQQCGRGELMKLGEPAKLDDLLADFNRNGDAMGLFPYEGECELSLRGALLDLKSQKPKHLWLFVGSEGGFSYQEVEKFQGVGLQPVTMGAQILRVETACLALVSIIKYELELMQ